MKISRCSLNSKENIITFIIQKQISMFTNKVVLITGGSEGIGLGIAQALAAQGAYVYLVGRTLSKLETAENSILEKGGQVESRSADITDADVIKEVVEDLYKDKGRLDIVINNAWGRASHGLEATFRDIWKLVELDMRAPYEITHYLVNKFKNLESQLKILTVVSQSALEVMEGSLGYGAAKMGLTAWLFHLEKEMKKENIDNIQIYRLYPSTVATDKMIEMVGENPMIDAVTVQAVAATAMDMLLDKTETRDVSIWYYAGKGVVRWYYPSTPEAFWKPTLISEEIVDANFTPKDIIIPEPQPSKY